MDMMIARTVGLAALAMIASGCVGTRRHPTYHGASYVPTVTAGYVEQPVCVSQPTYVESSVRTGPPRPAAPVRTVRPRR